MQITCNGLIYADSMPLGGFTRNRILKFIDSPWDFLEVNSMDRVLVFHLYSNCQAFVTEWLLWMPSSSGSRIRNNSEANTARQGCLT